MAMASIDEKGESPIPYSTVFKDPCRTTRPSRDGVYPGNLIVGEHDHILPPIHVETYIYVCTYIGIWKDRYKAVIYMYR